MCIRDSSCVAKRSREQSKASDAFALRSYLSAMRLRAGVHLVYVLVDKEIDRNRRAILWKIITLFGTSVPPALPNVHENNPKASDAFALRSYLSAMRLGAGVHLVYVLVDREIDRNRRAILRKIITLFGTSVPQGVLRLSMGVRQTPHSLLECSRERLATQEGPRCQI